MSAFLTLGCLTVILVSVTHAQMYDPFQKTVKMKKTNSPSLLLMPLPPLLSEPMFNPTVVTAVMNDKAFINGQWYKVGDTVNAQQITSIQADFVALKEGNRLTMLGVGNQQRVLKTKESR